MSGTIVVVGSLNLDLVTYVARMPAEGETLAGKDFAMFPGGKGANQAVAAARLGGRVSMVGRVGEDDFAVQLRQALEQYGVDAGCVLAVKKPTGTAVILVTDCGGNSIVVIPGANATLMPEDIEASIDMLRSAAVILSQLEIPMETVVRLAEIANELGVPFILDPAPARELPLELLRNVTWLTPNETETRVLLDSIGCEGAVLKANDALDAAADRLLATGIRNVVLKLGSEGVYLAGADVERQMISGFHVRAVDTTAAGDAFNGGFAYALTEGKSPADAARFGCAVAAISVTRDGAQPSMPGLEEVREFLRRSRESGGEASVISVSE